MRASATTTPTGTEVEQRLFLRMYGEELPSTLLQRGLERIARDRAPEDARGLPDNALATHFVSCVH